ncbi:MAG: flagellar hook capping FlgD N-terminal domain-containing protein [Limnochordia bacterium]|jgi:flagellar basal-body rod modification protein FlgD|nr:flagellar hook capping protein [Bacillota bacterium]
MQVYGVSSGQNTENTFASQEILGKDAFLRLLLTELRYQDPLNPVSDKEFVAQLAQFSALEQTQNLNANFERFANLQVQLSFMTQAASLLGREVEVYDDELEQVVQGKVSAVKLDNDGFPWITVGDFHYPLGNLRGITG